jgi:N-acetylmuramoyl-L-alanine amidase
MFFRRQLKPATAATPPPAFGDTESRAAIIDTLARTIWGEARGETLTGKESVANVILNRFKLSQRRGKMWWGNTIEEICKKPYQFSCWNSTDPNYLKLLAVREEDLQFGICLRIARRAVNGVLADHTNGADHYHADYVTPKWADARVPTAIIGAHLFYQLEK